uniref:Protein kinase domain-containing protein n=1 Tax=Ananas comosus var. bracteatus TaxID=296719 RepID=A0A6V7QB09_ANACO|nr:unnamed protein product [Ananas comosus var. bracteatus]
MGSSLRSLNLSFNRINGSLPNNVGDFGNNRFEGEIPDAILRSKSLVSVDFSGNLLYGTLPDDFGNSMQSLEELNLAGNRINGSLPASSGLNSLTYLNLSGNLLHGSILGILCQQFPSFRATLWLEYLNLSKTGLSGRIPPEFSQLVRLKTLDLSQNHISGQIPDLSAENLQILDLSVNNLTGNIPPSLQQKLPNMERFNFSYNNLTFCASQLSPQSYSSSFIGSRSDCPIAVNPNHVRRKEANRRDVKVATSVPVVIFEKPLSNFTFADLLNATSHFDRGTLLAEGRFGPVYRGFLPGGVQVAVKVLVHGSALTDEEAARELERLGRIKHPNLVPLTGYCLAGDQRIAIYEYMENGNLQNLLHDLPLGNQTTEDWSTDTWEDNNGEVHGITQEGIATWRFRHKIALGAARALAFLHHACIPQIVHRDVKASSIYFDSSMEPRLADFGLSKIAGTNLESDFSQGLPGEEAFGDEYGDKGTSLASWARAMVKRNEGSSIIDPKIRETASEKEIEEALRIAYLCTRIRLQRGRRCSRSSGS